MEKSQHSYLFIQTTTKQNNNKSIEIHILEANFSICWIWPMRLPLIQYLKQHQAYFLKFHDSGG